MGKAILIIYTGGTIGMKQDPETGTLVPFNFRQIKDEVPELKKFKFRIDTISFNPLIDSSDIQPDFWVKLVLLIKENYDDYDGFVILHGTDTMSYTASALSFMLQNLSKPVILTGSQLPIGILRTDGRENLISAIEIAAENKNDTPMVQEVCVFFQNMLFRGNRTIKYNAENFNAFRSENFPPLAEAGITIRYNFTELSKRYSSDRLGIYTKLDTNVLVLKLFPGIQSQVLDGIFAIDGLKAVVLETFGTGNASTGEWFIKRIKEAVNKGIIILNVTQCPAGRVEMDLYDTGVQLKKAGVISGYDLTVEAAITKLMYLLGRYNSINEVKKMLDKPISGEFSLE
ncbi:MAG: asparaginase [Prevotellaceae bacterium]|jgi:L-asparaginase|nr:asparaginase [Prevotellaceae bacterium]